MGGLHMKMAKVAMMQMYVKTNDPETNLLHAAKLLDELCETEKPDFVLYPETCDVGWASAEAEEYAGTVPGGAACEAFREMAVKHQVYLVAGLTEKDGSRIFNTAVFFSPEGELLAKHRKINVLQDVEGIYEIGDRVQVVETSFGRVGLDICADNFESSTVFLHVMGRMGARMVLSPCAWAVVPDFDISTTPCNEMWRQSYSRMSQLYRMPVIGVSNVGALESGPWKDHKAIGNSMAYGTDGKQIIELPFGVDEEITKVIEVKLAEEIAKGTDFAGALLRRGYFGLAEEILKAPEAHGDGSVV